MKIAVVTGAAGFTGANLVEHLLDKECFVFAIVRPNSRHNYRLTNNKNKNLEVIEVDRNDFGKIGRVINSKCDDFYHLAWQGDMNISSEQNENIRDTLNALDSAVYLGCEKFICTGSQAEYGSQNGIITEKTFPRPITAYGAAKLATCILSKVKAEELGIKWIWGRIFSLYGKYEPESTMLSYLRKSLNEGRTPILTEGSQIWDYLDVGEAAEALIALSNLGRAGEIYNIANGDYKPLRDYVEKIHKNIAPNVNIKYRRNNDRLISLQPSVKKIFEHTGWKAGVPFGNY